MKQELINTIETYLWRQQIEEIPAAIEPHIDEIDFYDDDDAEKIIDFIIRAACNYKDISLLEYFISKGFDINFKLLGKDCLILRLADRSTDASVFAKFAELGADVYSEDNSGDNALILAARRVFKSCFGHDNLEELAVHIVKNYDISRLDKADKFGITPLMYAVINDKQQLAEALIEKGSNVNDTGAAAFGGYHYWMEMNGVSPLALAVRHGNLQLFKKLIEAGADESICDANGIPPVFSLLQFPFNFIKEQFRYDHPLLKRKQEIVKLIKNLDATNGKGYTALVQSLCERTQGYYTRDITMALIENGANVNAAGNDGKRAIHYAAEYRGTDVVKALIKAGADINAQDNNGNTALLLACKEGDEKTARYLLRAGADFNLKNNKGETPAEFAATNGLNDVLELMI